MKLPKGVSKLQFVDFNLQKVVLKLQDVVLNLTNALLWPQNTLLELHNALLSTSHGSNEMATLANRERPAGRAPHLALIG